MGAHVVPSGDVPRHSLVEYAAAAAAVMRSIHKTDKHAKNSHPGERNLANALAERSPARRIHFWIKIFSYLGSILWNVASPIKSYVLSFYGLPGDDLVVAHKVNWTTEIDYPYARALYDMSGVKYTAPEGEPIRFINMYTDFVVFNRASKWAHYLDDFQQDPYVGLFCRTSLVAKADKIKPQMEDSCSRKSLYSGNNYLEQQSCRVNEVSEAVMCLKGINVTQLLNYEWDATYNTSNAFIQEGARLYQSAIFPDLDACLDRRRYLVDLHGRDEALHQLCQELAANYSLDPTGFAGKRGLFAEYRYYDGFYDFTRRLSGLRYSRMDGSVPLRTQPLEPDLNALVLGRERLWWLVGETPENFQKKILTGAYFAPYLFLGMHINNKATTGRFVDRYTMMKNDTVGFCQNWALVPTSNRPYPEPAYSGTRPRQAPLVLYSSTAFAKRIVQDNNVTVTSEINNVPSRISSVCLARDGCLDLCTQAGIDGWLTTFDRSGQCQAREVLQAAVKLEGFVDWRCFGEGLGTDAMLLNLWANVTRDDNSTFGYHTVHNLADPGAVVACILGGRTPQAGAEPYPNVFFDLLNAGANVIITTTFSRGTEKLLLNVNALLSLVGCTVFSLWVLGHVFNAIRGIKRTMHSVRCGSRVGLQLLDSLFTSNVSTVIHGRNIQLSKFILWLNLVAWYVGAADSNCTWWVDGVDLWTPGFELKPSDAPYYKCKPGAFFTNSGSILGAMRIFSMSYNFYSLTCQHLIFRGATRYIRPFATHIIVFGVIPTLFAATIITSANHLRLWMGYLDYLHNQVFLVLLWTVFLFAYHGMLRNRKIGSLYVDLVCRWRLCGKQKIRHGTVAEALVGSYYLTLPEFVRHEEVEWIPLSVAMESALFRLDHLDIAARTYSLTIPIDKTSGTATTSHSSCKNDKPLADVPQWVRDDDEYLFR